MLFLYRYDTENEEKKGFKYVYKYKTVFYLSVVFCLESVCIEGRMGVDYIPHKCSQVLLV